MSHTTAIKSVKITDLAAMRQAVTKLQQSGINCELKQNVIPRMYYKNQHGKCEYVLALPDCLYDVGFDKQEDGTYLPVFDEWAGEVKNQIGASCSIENRDDRSLQAIGQFLQQYSVEAAVNAAQAQGYYVESTEVDDNGNVQLTIGTGM